MAERMFPFVIRMPKELYDRLEEEAAADNRSTSGMARLLIERGLSRPEPKQTAGKARKA